MKTKAIGSRLFACLAVSLIAAGCQGEPTGQDLNEEGIIPSGPFVSFSHATGPGCVTVNFNDGTGVPVSYEESGIIVTSLHTATSRHLHFNSTPGTLFNHSGCCSTPYKFERTDGAAFTVASLDVVGGSGTTTGTFTSSSGAVESRSNTAGTLHFPTTGWTGITSFQWSEVGGSGNIDNLVICPGNQAPTADAGTNQTLDRTSAAGVDPGLDGSGSTDPDGNETILTYVWTDVPATGPVTTIPDGKTPTVTLPLGVHTITLVVTDDGGLTDDDEVVITVNNVPPVANAGPDQLELPLEGAAKLAVTLDGSGSSDDVDGDGSPLSFEWSTAALAVPATGESPIVDLPVGVHTITLVVTDNDGATNTNTEDGTSTDNVVVIEVRFVIPAGGGSAPIEENDKKVGEVDVPSGAFGEDVVLVFQFVDIDPCHNDLISQYGRCLSAEFTTLAGVPIPLNEGVELTYAMCLPLPLVTAGVTDPLIIYEFDDADSPVFPRADFDVDLDCSGFVAAEPGNGLMRFARGLVDRVTQFFAPEPLVAAPVVFRGDNGRGWTGFASLFVWANPIVVQPTAGDFDTQGVINCTKPKDFITIGVLSTDDSNDLFLATDIDVSTVFFGLDVTVVQEIHRNKKTGEFVRHETDLSNADGLGPFDDMVFHFQFADTGLVCDETIDQFARLSGLTTGGAAIVSADFVRIKTRK